jgi:hypothetical protein
VHALTITTSGGVLLAVHEEDIENHGLNMSIMIAGFVRESLNILKNLCPYNLILADAIPW